MFQFSVNGTVDLINRQVVQVEEKRHEDEDQVNRVKVSNNSAARPFQQSRQLPTT